MRIRITVESDSPGEERSTVGILVLEPGRGMSNIFTATEMFRRLVNVMSQTFFIVSEEER